MLALTGEHTIAYGAVFCLGFIGLAGSWIALRFVMRGGKPKHSGDAEIAVVLSQALD